MLHLELSWFSGRILSEQITRRVILGVLAIMLVKPFIEITPVDHVHTVGLEQLFWVGSSVCGKLDLNRNTVSGTQCVDTSGLL